MVRALVAQEHPDSSSRILEMGCSAGLLMKELQTQGLKHVTGIDISPEAIALCQSAGLDAHLMDAQQLELPDASFDLVTASDVLEHLADEQKAVREWKRVLKATGLLVVFVPAFMLLWTEHDEANKHYRRYRRKQLVNLLELNGFIIERSSYWNAFLFLPIAAIRLLRRILPRRAEPKGSGDLTEPPRFANALLVGLLQLENRILRLGLNWPFGVSVFVLARKPPAGQSSN
jgi:2-polyprenyl-3-methyl-5-hydroxy-6-metoxy-1,4-benzoquinol methylase